MSPDSRIFIDETGTADIRLRIEDVSKNHQGQSFKIRVGPNTKHSPINSDISPDVSQYVCICTNACTHRDARRRVVTCSPANCSAIAVRSKRNKRQREKLTTRQAQEPGSPSATRLRPSYEMPLNAPTAMSLDAEHFVQTFAGVLCVLALDSACAQITQLVYV
jgi:hypothetical protein